MGSADKGSGIESRRAFLALAGTATAGLALSPGLRPLGSVRAAPAYVAAAQAGADAIKLHFKEDGKWIRVIGAEGTRFPSWM